MCYDAKNDTKKMTAIHANGLLVSHDAVLVVMLTTGQPKLPPPAGDGNVG